MQTTQTPITAAIGAAVRFFPSTSGDADLSAFQVGEIAHLWSDKCANIQFTLPDDRIVIRSSVPLFQQGQAHGIAGYYAELIPPQASTQATSTTAEAKPQPKVITPTIGRRVWYWPSDLDRGLLEIKPHSIIEADTATSGQACDAGVVRVFNDRLVNLSVTDHNGNVHKRTSVTLYQPGDNISHSNGGYCTWMDYQVKQAQAEPEPITATLGSFDPSTARLASPILRYFNSAHLPSHLQEIAECIEMCAQFFDDVLPNGPEKSTSLRKLLEAKDCAVRAALDMPPDEQINVELRTDDPAVDLRDVLANGLTGVLSNAPIFNTENPDHGFDDEAIGDRSDGVGEGPAGESDHDLPDTHPN